MPNKNKTEKFNSLSTMTQKNIHAATFYFYKIYVRSLDYIRSPLKLFLVDHIDRFFIFSTLLKQKKHNIYIFYFNLEIYNSHYYFFSNFCLLSDAVKKNHFFLSSHYFFLTIYTFIFY